MGLGGRPLARPEQALVFPPQAVERGGLSPFWRGDHVSLKQLAEDFAQNHYLPRLKDTDVLLGAVREGLSLSTWENETFGSADGFDPTRGKYQGLRAGEPVSVSAGGSDLLVKPDVARQHLEAGKRVEISAGNEVGGGRTNEPVDIGGNGGTGTTGTGKTGAGTGTGVTVAKVKASSKPFHGAIGLDGLDALRLSRDGRQIAQEIVQHLSGLVGAEVEVTMEIQAKIPDGVPDKVVRTVAENCRTLRFISHGFEDE